MENLDDPKVEEIVNPKKRMFERHGMAGSKTYASWDRMLRTCYYARASGYTKIGGSGVVVCERWKNSFRNFLADMGERPDKMVLGRFPNKDGNFELGNCRWVVGRNGKFPTTFVKCDPAGVNNECSK